MTIAIILATLSLILCVISFLYLHWYINRKISAEAFIADYRTEVEKLNAEIDAATDRDSLLVEARIKALKQLLEDADRRIAVYGREMDRRQTSAATQSQLAKKPTAPIQPELVPQPVTPSQVETPAVSPVQPTIPLYNNLGRGGFGSGAGGGDRLDLRIVNVTEPEPTVATVADNATAAVASEKKELRVQIAELAAQGLTPAEIVSQLEVSRSEVDTVLSLSRLKRNSA